jgi:C4-dicarboxylate transporter, DctM subunit
VGAVAALIGFFYTRTLRLGDLPLILICAPGSTRAGPFLVAAAGVFSWVLIFGQVPQTAAAWIQSVATTPVAFMLLVLVALLIVGTVIDGIPG